MISEPTVRDWVRMPHMSRSSAMAMAAIAAIAIISPASAFAPSVAGLSRISLARSSVAAPRGCVSAPLALSMSMHSKERQTAPRVGKMQRLSKAVAVAAASVLLFSAASSAANADTLGQSQWAPTSSLLRAAASAPSSAPTALSLMVVADAADVEANTAGFVPMSKKDLLKVKVSPTHHNDEGIVKKTMGKFIVWIFPLVLVVLPIYYIFPWDILTGYNKDGKGNKRNFIK
mmetsp:Transcript_65375/g.156146  ORF Transcript_65375/g.156146 Transcript_65375/m.156146 type:complete len:231 (+) Transcript_65375:3-695(+)